MDFFDTYEITRSGTPNVDHPDHEQPTLNEEVNEVIGQLGRFWGGFRKQSQQAIETARKDFGDVVVQAQQELSKLTVGNETPRASTFERTGGEATPVDTSESVESIGSTDESNTSTSISRESPTGEGDSGISTAQTFFSRLQASLPPNIVSTVQNHIPESIRHVSENIDLGHLRSTLVSDFQRVQGVTLTQAEEYFHKSEALLREAVKEAGEVLKDAVKVIPPEEGSTGSAGMVWDGSDVWMLPYENGPDGEGAMGRPSSSTSSSKPAAEQLTAAAVATRAEALLKRLKRDASILRHDPEEDVVVKADFLSWQAKQVDSKEGGIEGTEWSGKIAAALDDPVDGPALKELEESLVPAEITKTAFWVRFFFRSHQIRTEEERRKALIQSTTETDDDFSWEDDEDESNKPGTSAPDEPEEQKQGIAPTEALLGVEPTRRVSSSDSFDLVSAASASASVSVVGDTERNPKGRPEDEEDVDSDWE